jgi:hypothetical protein
MRWIRNISIGGNVYPLPHPFEEEVEWLVRTNHQLLCERLIRIEEEEVSRLSKQDADESEIGSEIAFTRSNSAELRKEANSLSLVALVTRFQHWVRILVGDLRGNTPKTFGLKNHLEALKELGDGCPVPVEYFYELETVRDSIIHADSDAEWMRGAKRRRVVDKYLDTGLEHVELTEAHILEAIENSIKQVRFYQDRLDNVGGGPTL